MPSKLTKAKDITEKTKHEVIKRQDGYSISGVWLGGKEVEFHHFIERGREGIGYEWNVIALLKEEHRAVHDRKPIKVNGKEYYSYKEFQTLMKNHLIINYYGWSEKSCIYHKGFEEKDYGIRRRNDN